MKTIYTYFEEPGHDIIKIFCESWSSCGWLPIVLTKDLAEKHPLYDLFIKEVSKYSTINTKSYELICYKRWLAFSQINGGFFSDYDIINFGRVEPLPISSKAHGYFGNAAALVYMDSEILVKIPHLLLSYSDFYPLNPSDLPPPNHVSDMFILGSLNMPRYNLVSEYHKQEDRKLLVHYWSNYKDKAKEDWNNYLGTRSAPTNLPVTE